ncbi:MAG: leucine-rich repeat domain-containing protein [Bacteroidota bacterium]
MKTGKIYFILYACWFFAGSVILFLSGCKSKEQEEKEKPGDFSNNNTTLSMRKKELTEIPSFVFEETQLKELILEKNELTALPPEIGKLTGLEILDVDQNQLRIIPDEIGQLVKLKELDLDYNILTELPSSIGNLEELRDIDMEMNAITRLPDEITKLKNLQVLHAGTNRLKSLPAGFEKLKKLKTLDIGNNNFSEFPASVFSLPEMDMLIVRNNKLDSVPQDIGKLKSLIHLDISFNQLTKLPDEIKQLHHLHYLDVSNNQLTELPDSLWLLPHLTSLNISGNPLKSIPAELVNLPNLLFYYDSSQALLIPPDTTSGVDEPRYIQKVPSFISGRPVNYYMQNPEIDSLSKSYVRGELDLRKGDLRQLLEYTEMAGPGERNFYFFVFHSALVHYRFEADTTEEGIRDRIKPRWEFEDKIAGIASDYLVNDPCLFFGEVKYGSHKKLYEMLIISAMSRLQYGFVKDIDADVKRRLRNSCGEKYISDWEEIVTLLKKQWEEEEAEAMANEEE